MNNNGNDVVPIISKARKPLFPFSRVKIIFDVYFFISFAGETLSLSFFYMHISFVIIMFFFFLRNKTPK